jgi:hypothetical protein
LCCGGLKPGKVVAFLKGNPRNIILLGKMMIHYSFNEIWGDVSPEYSKLSLANDSSLLVMS